MKMKNKKKQVNDGDLCAIGLTDPLERKLMATSMKSGQDQINFLREARIKKQETQNEDGSEE